MRGERTKGETNEMEISTESVEAIVLKINVLCKFAIGSIAHRKRPGIKHIGNSSSSVNKLSPLTTCDGEIE